MIEQLDDVNRQAVGHDIGAAIFGAVVSPLVQESARINTGHPQADTLFKAALMYALTSEEKWMIDPSPDIRRVASKHTLATLSLVNTKLCTGAYPGIEASPENLGKLTKKACDLACEAYEDGMFWFSMISAMEPPACARDDLISHPVFPSAIGLDQKVHFVVKEIYNQLDEYGMTLPLPRTRTEFIGLYAKAPEIFGAMGIRLEGYTAGIDARQRGFCPANHLSPGTNQRWYKTLLETIAPIYLATRQ